MNLLTSQSPFYPFFSSCPIIISQERMRENPGTLTRRRLTPLAGEVMADLDADRNGHISSGEWLKYGSRTHDAVDRELYDAVAREED